ncbi:MAG: dTDP-4-dehydrorhamnose reductase [Halioglobus sp.]|nr:dTDP-4-dehydrorhamnose reductase [Halioglobus sp.]
MDQKVLVLGAGGQLGRELQRTVPEAVDALFLTRAELDIADGDAVLGCITDVAPRQIINAAAYTAVDKAESETEAAYRDNAEGPGVLARACSQWNIRFIHISTDFVFDGVASTPYKPDAETAPLGQYGCSKLAGELAVRQACPTAVLIRTGWVYSAFGGNFVKTMLRLMGERDELAVVVDQVGTPTWAHGLAQATWAAVARPALAGIYHWSDAGVCSCFYFATAIAEEAQAVGLLGRSVRVRPIPAAEYPTPAQRPAYSVLDKTSSWRDLELEGTHWRQQLRAMLMDYKEMADG